MTFGFKWETKNDTKMLLLPCEWCQLSEYTVEIEKGRAEDDIITQLCCTADSIFVQTRWFLQHIQYIKHYLTLKNMSLTFNPLRIWYMRNCTWSSVSFWHLTMLLRSAPIRWVTRYLSMIRDGYFGLKRHRSRFYYSSQSHGV